MTRDDFWGAIVAPRKQEAIRFNRRQQKGLRNPLPPLPHDNKEEDKPWEIIVPWASVVTMSHEFWLAEQSHQALLALRECVEINPQKLGGVPVFQGTRFSIAQFLAELADSPAVGKIANNYDVDRKTLRKFLHALSTHLNKPIS